MTTHTHTQNAFDTCRGINKPSCIDGACRCPYGDDDRHATLFSVSANRVCVAHCSTKNLRLLCRVIYTLHMVLEVSNF